jgi:hypothetical protein
VRFLGGTALAAIPAAVRIVPGAAATSDSPKVRAQAEDVAETIGRVVDRVLTTWLAGNGDDKLGELMIL